MAFYIRSADPYKCPADTWLAQNGPRVRSYSMSGAVGGDALRPFSSGQSLHGRVYPTLGARTMSALSSPGPASVVVFLEEHPDGINDGSFAFDAAYPPVGCYWRDLPASTHNGAAALSYGDGHAETHQWKDALTIQAVHQTNRWWGTSLRAANSIDYAWFNDHVPYR